MSRDFIHLELQQLRASIRQDLHEELGRFLAGSHAVGSQPASLDSSQASPLRTTAWGKKVVPSPAFGEPVLLPCDTDEPAADRVLRLSASDVDGAEIIEWHGADSVDKVEGFTTQSTGEFEDRGSLSEEIRPPPFKKGAKTVMFNSANDEVKLVDSLESKKTSEKDAFSGLEESLWVATTRASEAVRLSHSESGTLSFQNGTNFNKSIRSVLHRGNPKPRKSKKQIEREKQEEAPLSFDEVFELVAGFAIVVNGIFIGVQTEVMANKRTEEAPIFFFYAEIAFCAIFSFELILKLVVQRCTFFTGPMWYWNLFDIFLVFLQLLDVIMEIIGNVAADLQLSFLRMLRILRILRVLRLMRLLKFFGELNVVTSAIANSLKSLYGTVLMLLLMIYIFAIAFTGAANSKLVSMRDSGINIDGTPLDVWWSSLGRTVLSLYESILGGVDWDDLVQGLLEMNMFWTLLFLVYISFMMLTMLNVITGIFVDSAVKHATRFHEKAFANNMRRLFNNGDNETAGVLTREEFNNQWSRPEFHFYMKQVGIEPREARLLFDILDVDNSEDIEAEEFLAGMLRLRAGAKFIDIMNLQHVIDQQRLYWKQHLKDMSAQMRVFANARSRSGALSPRARVDDGDDD